MPVTCMFSSSRYRHVRGLDVRRNSDGFNSLPFVPKFRDRRPPCWVVTMGGEMTSLQNRNTVIVRLPPKKRNIKEVSSTRPLLYLFPILSSTFLVIHPHS